MRLVEVFTTLTRARLPAQITSAAALPITGRRAVLGRHERNDRTAAVRVAEELEASLMRVAVDPRPAWGGVAVLNAALGRPRHACARQLHDLSNPLSREPTAQADAR